VWAEQGGLIVATSALRTRVDFAGIVYILHVGMLWSITNFAQASGQGGRGREAFNVVVVLKHREVERRIEQESEEMEVVAMGQFLIGSRCQQQLMSLYIDVKGVGCREIRAVSCDQCREGEDR
jgi:hypothetical protein